MMCCVHVPCFDKRSRRNRGRGEQKSFSHSFAFFRSRRKRQIDLSTLPKREWKAHNRKRLPQGRSDSEEGETKEGGGRRTLRHSKRVPFVVSSLFFLSYPFHFVIIFAFVLFVDWIVMIIFRPSILVVLARQSICSAGWKCCTTFPIS